MVVSFELMAAGAAVSAVPTSSLYIPSLDGMRALAFLIVFVAHSLPFNILPGGFGVTIFFFLSGYLITTLLRNEAETTGRISLRGFYNRRVLRIFPPCYVTIVVVGTLAALGVLYNVERFTSLISGFLYFSNYWNILGWGNLPAGLGVLWSLAIEEHYYLLYPLLFAWFVRSSMMRRYQAIILLALCSLALGWRCYRVFVMHSSWEQIYEGTDTRFDSILFGCVLAIVANPRCGDRVDWIKKYAHLLAAAGAFLIALTFAYRNVAFRSTIRYTLQSIALMPIFFFVILPQKNLVIRILESRVLRHLGRLSYSMYLIHHALFHHFYHHYRPGILIAGIVFLLTLAYAQLMRTCVELPIQKARAGKKKALIVPIDSGQRQLESAAAR